MTKKIKCGCGHETPADAWPPHVADSPHRWGSLRCDACRAADRQAMERTPVIVPVYNVSNHPSSRWGDDQLYAAKGLGINALLHQCGEEAEDYLDVEVRIVDVPFPAIDPGRNIEIMGLPEVFAGAGLPKFFESPCAVIMQGEMTTVLAAVVALALQGVPCYAATTERKVKENADGTKTVAFEFRRFRRYVVPTLPWNRLNTTIADISE